MQPIPDSWPPPEEVSSNQADVPVFPLNDVWLFPGILMPLRIFEPRYRQMIEDCLDGPGKLVLGTVASAHQAEMAGAPPLQSIAGLGEIVRHERLENGDYSILLLGLHRVRVEEIESDRLYRRVRAEKQHETLPGDRKLNKRLRKDLKEALLSLDDEAKKLPENIPLGYLVDLLLSMTAMPSEEKQKIFAELDVGQRSILALEAYRSNLGDN